MTRLRSWVWIGLSIALLSAQLQGMPLSVVEASLASEPVINADSEYMSDRIIIKLEENSGGFSLFSFFSSDYFDPSDFNLISLEKIVIKEEEPLQSGFFSMFSSTKTQTWYSAKLDDNTTVDEALEALKNHPKVLVAEPDYIYRTAQVGLPDETTDPNVGQQWYLENIKAPQAWEHLQSLDIPFGGSRDIIVAVIDTGVDFNHVDLNANMWVNSREILGNGQDDDGNGVVDDYYGYNAVYENGNPMDDHGHGTHVAGIIAMAYNNQLGGVGIASNVQIMAIKAANASGFLTASNIAKGINYAVTHGADVINMSFGGYGASTLVREALEVAFGTSVLIAAAGNDGIGNEFNSTRSECIFNVKPLYPAAYDWVIGVMAHDASNSLAGFSNYDCQSENTIEYEISAPGVGIYSTIPNNRYASWSGTSMATPVVAATAALILTKFTDRTIYNSRFVMGQLASTSNTYVRQGLNPEAFLALDAYKALTTFPQPNLGLINHYFFDSVSIHPDNNGDKYVDAGEVVDLAVLIKNRWGFASDVSITVDALSPAQIPNPFVKFIVEGEEEDSSTINIGNVGNFGSSDNGLMYDGVEIVGVNKPFRLKISESTQNDEPILLNVTILAKNGLNPEDETEYVFYGSILFVVKNAVILPSIINQDTTLTKDKLWIIDKPTLVERGSTLTIEPGTTVQFYHKKANDPYHTEKPVYLQIDGDMIAHGTKEEMINFVTGFGYEQFIIDIRSDFSNKKGSIKSANIVNPYMTVKSITYSDLNSNFDGHLCYFYYDRGNTLPGCSHRSTLLLDELNHSKIVLPLSNLQIAESFGNIFNLRSASDAIEKSVSNVFLNSKGVLEATHIANRAPYQMFDSIQFNNGRNVALIKFGSEILATLGNYKSLKNIHSFLGNLNAKLFQFKDNIEIDTLIEYANFGVPPNNYYLTGNTFDSLKSITDDELFGLYSSRFYHQQDHIDEERIMYFYYTSHNNQNQFYTNFTNESWAFRYYPWLIEVENFEDFDEKVTRYLNSFYVDNAILNSWNSSINQNLVVQTRGGTSELYTPFANNYWNAPKHLVDMTIIDYTKDFSRVPLVYEPMLTVAPETPFPFVVDAYLSNSEGTRLETVSSEKVFVNVEFNRDMDQSVQPFVAFGPSEPYSDYVISGQWLSPRHWQGETTISPILADGWQFFRVQGGVSEHDSWFVSGIDKARFQFRVNTAGTAAMNLQASGEENQVRLQWIQDDFDLLAGYNIYRSDSVDGTYTKLNTTIIPDFQKEYVDTTVNPGQTYYYAFTVVQTDFVESQYSNIASATPIDNVPPMISHTPITSASPNLSLTLSASVTDNIAVQSVTLYYKSILSPAWSSKAMIHAGSNVYRTSIESSVMTAPGVLYYIQASDGVSIARSGSASVPHTISITDAPIITSVTPATGSTLGGEVVDIIGTNFKSGATVIFNNSPASEVTWISSTRLRVKTPHHAPSIVDIKVTNPDGYFSVLAKAFTFVSTGSEISLPNIEGYLGQIIQVPVYLASVNALMSLELEMTYDHTVLELLSVSNGALTTSFASAHNTQTPGLIRSALASSSYVSGDGSVLMLEFLVIGEEDENSYPITIESVNLNDGAISLSIIDGVFTYATRYRLSGDVRYFSNNSVVPNVKVAIFGQKLIEVITDDQGQYVLSGIELGEYTYQLSKSDHVYAISAMDASYTLMHAVGLTNLSQYQQIAADVNMSGTITAMDASYILQRAAGLLTGVYPGSQKVWHFIPPTQLPFLINSNASQSAIIAILLGDVSGNWSVDLE